MPLRLTALTLAALLALSPAHAADKLTLMLDWFINPDHAPIILAQDKGFFTEAGLEVEIIAPADPSDPPRLVAAGKADLAVGYQPQLHLQVHEGLPLVRVGTLVGMPLSCLMVQADGPVQSIADLKGRKIGYSVAGVEEATLGAFRNFELKQMELAGGKGRCFHVEEEGLPAYDELIFLANRDSLNREQVARFMQAIEKATQYMLNHPEEAKTTFAAHAPDLGDALNTAAWDDTFGRFALSPAALDHGRYARFEAFLLEAGLIESALPISKLALDVAAQP